MSTTFQKGQNIIHRDKIYQCIVSDEETAVFAKIKKRGESVIADHTKLFTVSNISNDDFKFSFVEMADIKKHFQNKCCNDCDCGYD